MWAWDDSLALTTILLNPTSIKYLFGDFLSLEKLVVVFTTRICLTAFFFNFSNP